MDEAVIASAGDCLCGIAIQWGYLDCQPLRSHPQNRPLLSRPLREGDVVIVPVITPPELPRGVDARHVFRARNTPPVSIRFVREEDAAPHYRNEVATLHVSNYVPALATTVATGYDSTFHDRFGYDEPTNADPDTFKIEIVDPRVHGRITARLEALRPLYEADPTHPTGLRVRGHEPFTGDERAIAEVTFSPVAGSVTTFLSRYLRLVVDEVDKQAAPGARQLLLVTDMADGRGTGQPADNDSVEILDQRVRATYTIPHCPGTPKCFVSTEKWIGGGERKRVRICFHLFAPDDTPAFRRAIRRKTLRWMRRILAQADMAPRIVAPEFRVYTAPTTRMLTISDRTGLPARGSGTIRLRLSLPGQAPVNVPPIPISDGMTPLEVGQRIAEHMPPEFLATAHAAPPLRRQDQLRVPCDVMISSDSGVRPLVQVLPSTNSQLRLRVRVVSVDFNNIDGRADQSYIQGSADVRYIMRSVPGITDDVVHLIFVGKFSDTTLGFAFLPHYAPGVPAGRRPDLPFRSAVLLPRLDSQGSLLYQEDDMDPYILAHEIGHVLTDAYHVDRPSDHFPTQVMHPHSPPLFDVSLQNPKRFGDHRLLVPTWLEAGAVQAVQSHNVVSLLRTRGAERLEDW
jgi:hypothetical protein